MRLNGLDLNLLVTLDALLQDASVTRAAARLSVSQPAVSAALGRLRRHFDDELLHRVGNTYELTPLAADLRDLTAVAVAAAQRVFDARSQSRFNPAVSDREFRLFASDYAMAVFAPVVSELLRERAPTTSLRINRSTQRHLDHAEELMRTMDGLLLPHGYIAGLPHIDLYDDGWRCLVSVDNAAVGADLSLDQLRALAWASVYHGSANTPAGRQLQMLGVEAKLEIVVESFLALPYVIAGTDRVALVQSRLAGRMAAGGEVRALACPFDPTPLVEALWWHPLYDRDPGHQWFRALLREAGQLVTEGAGPTRQTEQLNGRPPLNATMSVKAVAASNGSPSSA